MADRPHHGNDRLTSHLCRVVEPIPTPLPHPLQAKQSLLSFPSQATLTAARGFRSPPRALWRAAARLSRRSLAPSTTRAAPVAEPISSCVSFLPLLFFSFAFCFTLPLYFMCVRVNVCVSVCLHGVVC